jgi:FixJ family two-component response regulator
VDDAMPASATPGSLITIVDDDQSVRRALRRLLQSAGYATAAFASASEFLSSPAATDSACLVLDIYLEDGNGFALQSALAAAGSAIPIVFITAHDDTATRERVARSGAAACLGKPFDDQVLLDAVRRAMGERSR